MNRREVANRVRQITRASVLEPERAVAMEEELYFDVLNAIAAGNVEGDPAELARMAITTKLAPVRRVS